MNLALYAALEVWDYYYPKFIYVRCNLVLLVQIFNCILYFQSNQRQGLTTGWQLALLFPFDFQIVVGF